MSRFTKGELEVMRILWKHGELKPAEIQERFPWKIEEFLASVVSVDLARKRPSYAAANGEGVLLPR